MPVPSKVGPNPSGFTLVAKNRTIASARDALRGMAKIVASADSSRAAAPTAMGQAIDVPLKGE